MSRRTKNTRNTRDTKNTKNTQNIDEVLTTIVRQRHFEDKLVEQKVFSLWRDVVGEALANHARPASLSAGILTVWTEHPAYQTELSLLQVKILEGLNTQLGHAVVKTLRLELRPGQVSGQVQGQMQDPASRDSATLTGQKSSLPKRALTAETLTQVELSVAGITDEALKDALRRLFVTQCQEEDSPR